MELPKSKPSAAEIESMKEAGRQEYKNNKARVITHLKSRGLSNAAIAGIVGNIDVETGGSFDYTQKQTKSGDPRSSDIVKGGGYGLFQFDDPKNKAGHETWYREYLKQTDKEDSTESQLDYFLDMIMAGEDSKDPFYKYSSNMGAGNAGVIKAYLETNQNPRQISDAITDRFEKASIKHSDRRREAAEVAFEELQPSDRMDVDPNAQYINQSGNILDTGKDIPVEKEKFPMERVQDIPEEKSMYETIKPYVPILRHFNEGGAVPMQKQMEMFEDGGLKDEGGTVDPVSGNDVPPGSTQEEVRDDIPAQLSEGEFVFPADVVRFIGLNNLMQMRQQAKMGLKQMEEMGQMGNSDEATMPDDLPFDINDLDMEDEDEYNTRQEFAVGGMPTPNPNTGVYYNPAVTAPTTGVAAVPQQAASQQYVQPVQPVQAAVPTAPVYKPAEVPTFKGFIGENVPGVDFEYVEYKDEAGNVIKLRKSLATGDLLDPVPEGYTFVDPEATKVEEATVAPTTPQTTTVREDKGDADHAMKEEEMYGPGGGRLAIDGTIYGVSFDGVKFGEMRSLLGGLATGKPVPDNVTVNFKRGDTTFRLKGSEYNDLKNNLNTPEGQTIVNNAIDRTDTQDRVKAVFNRYEDALASDDKATSQNAQKVVNEMIKEAKRKNIDKDTGMIINPFEANRPTGDETQQTTTPSAPPTKAEDFGAMSPEDFGTSGDETSQGDSSGSYDPGGTSDPGQEQDFGNSSTGGYYDFNQGGLASKPKPKAKKKMKKGGLASKK